VSNGSCWVDMSRHDQFDPLYNKVYKNKNKNTNIN
jgi:hypothetical protein